MITNLCFLKRWRVEGGRSKLLLPVSEVLLVATFLLSQRLLRDRVLAYRLLRERVLAYPVEELLAELRMTPAYIWPRYAGLYSGISASL